MKFDCKEAKSLAARWASSDTFVPGPDELEGMRSHIASCADCASKYARLLPFFSGDGAAFGGARRPGFADAVMRRAVTHARAKPELAPRRIPFAPAPALAAAAVLAFAAFLGGFWAGGMARETPPDYVEVRFSLDAPAASTVELVGLSLDAGTDDRTAMRRGGDGRWTVTVRLRKDGVYTYGFMIDGGETIPDPTAEEYVDDGFGGRDSLLRL